MKRRVVDFRRRLIWLTIWSRAKASLSVMRMKSSVKAVGLGVRTGRDLADMSLADLQQFSPLITEDVFEVLTLEGSVKARNHIGVLHPIRCDAAAMRLRDWLAAHT